ncbi:hypothetical protein V8Z77_07615 [Stutzerimonas stutzeri]|uniref:hypothetical protein n=1 Tax=Stutzerimonas stutzeri TaxID=316 RepID=UPI0031D68A32
MDIEKLTDELETIIQENLEQGRIFSIEIVSSIWLQRYPNIEFKKPLTKIFAKEKISLASKSPASISPNKWFKSLAPLAGTG